MIIPVFLASNGSLGFQRAVTAGALNNNYDGISNNTFLRNTVVNGGVAGFAFGGDPIPALIAEELRVGALGFCVGVGGYPDCCPTELQADGSCKLVHDDVRALLLAADLTPIGNTILESSVSGNAGLGIDLTEAYAVSFNVTTGLFFLEPIADGITANDVNDIDSGPNNLQNFPTINFAHLDGGELNVHGHLMSERGKTYRIDIYGSPVGTAAPVEGNTHLGSFEVSTNNGGSTNYDAELVVTGVVETGSLITATVTEILDNQPGSEDDDYGSTSEFSAAIEVTLP